MLIVKIKFNPVTTETDLHLDPAKKIFFYNATKTSNSTSNERLWLSGLPLILPLGRKPDGFFSARTF